MERERREAVKREGSTIGCRYCAPCIFLPKKKERRKKKRGGREERGK